MGLIGGDETESLSSSSDLRVERFPDGSREITREFPRTPKLETFLSWEMEEDGEGDGCGAEETRGDLKSRGEPSEESPESVEELRALGRRPIEALPVIHFEGRGALRFGAETLFAEI